MKKTLCCLLAIVTFSVMLPAKSLVAYFSQTGEQYGVGVIEKGNTELVARYIADKTGADLFHIIADEDYPKTYNALTVVAKEELKNKKRPSLVRDITDFDAYDTLYLGYPIWWGDLPMAVYTFLENHDWKGKTIYPFCTHAGSGLSDTVQSIRKECKNAQVGKGLAIQGTVAQKSPAEMKKAVDAWLGK